VSDIFTRFSLSKNSSIPPFFLSLQAYSFFSCSIKEKQAEMSEPKDQAFKLFGKTIQVPEISVTTATTTDDDDDDDSQDQDRPSYANSSLDETNITDDYNNNDKRDHGEEDTETDDKVK
jgi:hypothetical protein